MNNKKFILTAKFFRHGKIAKDEQFVTCTVDQARGMARDLYNLLIDDGCRNVRIEIWEVIKTDYKGTVRG